MTEPFKIACHCGFETERPEELADHYLATQHIDVPVGTEAGDLLELVQMLATVQRIAAKLADGEIVELPKGMTMQRASEADILADETLTEEEKHQILSRFALAERAHEKKAG